MKTNHTKLIYGLLVAGAFIAMTDRTRAQGKDTTLRPTTIEVIQSYKPEVKQVPKPEFTPDLPPRDTSRPAFRYEVPQQTLYYSYSSLPIRPLALGRDTSRLPFPGYLRLAAGNLSTIMLDAGTAHLRGKDYETSLLVHHLSQQGKIRNQQQSLTGVELRGTLHRSRHAWTGTVSFNRNRYHYYGYDHSIYEYDAEDVRQTFTGIDAGIMVRNEGAGAWSYGPELRIATYNDAYDASERQVTVNVPFARVADSGFTYGAGVYGSLVNFSNPAGEISNNLFQLRPFVQVRASGFSARAGLYPSFGMNEQFWLLPDLSLSYRIPNSRLAISGGYEATVRQNTYRQLSTYNPYMFNMYETRQTRVDEIKGLLQTNLGDHFVLSGGVSWQQFRDLPVFLNDSADLKNFYVRYLSRVQAISFNAGLRYQVADAFIVNAALVYTNFNSFDEDQDRVWHEPGMQLKADLTYRPTAALSLTAYGNILNQIYALDRNHETIRLDGIFDLGAGAEYQFIPRLSAFINARNILNNRYERWYRYEAYGINILGGIRLKF